MSRADRAYIVGILEDGYKGDELRACAVREIQIASYYNTVGLWLQK